jgi:altronate hydrolase
MSLIALVKIHPQDNVAVATRELDPGTKVRTAEGDEVTLSDAVHYGWKVAIVSIGAGENIIKYGERIGTALRPIAPGEAVHTHNVSPLPLPDVYIEGT